MSFSPESLDRLLADKLAQAPPPAYEPAHWDQLEDQLQHLNHALQAAQPAASAPAALTVAAPLAGKLAVIGVSALLAGLTAVNGYFFYAATAARELPTAIERAPRAATSLVLPAAPAPAAALSAALSAVEVEARSAPRVVNPTPGRLTAPARSAGPAATAGAPAVASYPSGGEPLLAEPQSATAVSVSSPALPAVVTVPADPRPDSAAAGRSGTAGHPVAEVPASRLSPLVPNVITPNGDGLNDRFELPLPAGTCRLTVFDRANRAVFIAERYDNAWDGGSLPAGQYLYLIESLGSATRPTPGVLTIVR